MILYCQLGDSMFHIIFDQNQKKSIKEMPKEKSPNESDLKNDGQNWQIHEIWCKMEQAPSKLVNYHIAKFLNHQQSAVPVLPIVFQDRQQFSPFKSTKQIYGGWMGIFRSHFKFTSSRCFTISYFANILSSPNTHNPPSLPSTFSTSPINRALFFANFSTPRVSVGH